VNENNVLYLVFEFLTMDLKKYIDTIPRDQQMDAKLLKVCLSVSTSVSTSTVYYDIMF